MPLPAQCLPFIGPRVEEKKARQCMREKIRERRGRRERERIREPFVMGDMRMPEKEGTMVVGEEDKGGA